MPVRVACLVHLSAASFRATPGCVAPEPDAAVLNLDDFVTFLVCEVGVEVVGIPGIFVVSGQKGIPLVLGYVDGDFRNDALVPDIFDSLVGDAGICRVGIVPRVFARIVPGVARRVIARIITSGIIPRSLCSPGYFRRLYDVRYAGPHNENGR